MALRPIAILRRLNFLPWLTGPIFDKELRVSSRRRRNYWLRFGYLALLLIFVTLAWAGSTHFGSGQPVYQQQRMADVGRVAIMTILMVQFFALHLLAIVMLSTSISDEIQNRTLGVLMTTPINSFQIVMGKLASKLLQLVLLVAVSLPLLVLVRVFGGVPWETVVAGISITLTTALFFGAVSMYFSISSRRAYVVIIKTIFALAALYMLVPFLIGLVMYQVSDSRSPSAAVQSFLQVLFYGHPYYAVIAVIEAFMNPGRGGRGLLFGGTFHWWIHCLVMLLMSAGVLALCVIRVRKVALRQAGGETAAVTFVTATVPQARLLPPPGVTDAATAGPAAVSSTGPAGTPSAMDRPPATDRPPARPTGPQVYALAEPAIRRVSGSPIVWKELRQPLIRSRWKTLVLVGAALLILGAIYALLHDELNDRDVHIGFILVFIIIGLLPTVIVSATGITSEKESGTWQLLLGTTLSNLQIVFGKAVGALRRSLLAWILVPLHLMIFTAAGYIHPVAVLHLALILSSAVIFIIGAGIYFSTRFRKTTSAVTANLLLLLVLWLLLPILAEMGDNRTTCRIAMWSNPAVQAVVVLEGGSGDRRAAKKVGDLEYSWPNNYEGLSAMERLSGTTVFLGVTAAGYSLAGLQLMLMAARRLRRNIT